MAALLTIAAALGYGTLSALVPVFNAEVYVGVVAAATEPWLAWISTAALTLGTVVGKVLIFEAARRGSSRHRLGKVNRPRREPRTGLGRWTRRTGAVLLTWLGHRWRGSLTILAAAVLGIPPLLAVSVLAGLSRQNVYLFALAVFVGRFVRFAAITWPIVAVSH